MYDGAGRFERPVFRFKVGYFTTKLRPKKLCLFCIKVSTLEVTLKITLTHVEKVISHLHDTSELILLDSLVLLCVYYFVLRGTDW